MNEATAEAERFAEELTAGTDLTWRIERNDLGDPLVMVTTPQGDHHVSRFGDGKFSAIRPGRRGGEGFSSLDNLRFYLLNGLGAYFARIAPSAAADVPPYRWPPPQNAGGTAVFGDLTRVFREAEPVSRDAEIAEISQATRDKQIRWAQAYIQERYGQPPT